MPASSASVRRPSLYVVDFHRQSRFYESWVSDCGFPVEWLHEFAADWEPPDDALLLVSAETYSEPSVSVLRRGVEKQIPVLILADGILEYRNTWQNATQVAGNLWQPVLGHKLACLGASQCRHVESWGNAGVCEVVGFPAFDDLIGDARTRHDAGGPAGSAFRLLVATARRPYFDEAQQLVAHTQLSDLRRALAEWQARQVRPTRVLWRIAEDLADAIGLDADRDAMADGPVSVVLRACDAVITTPSTLMVEAMLFDLPVAVLDYFEVPQYVPAAWRIGRPDQMPAVLDELIRPPMSRRQFQRVTLHDALACETPAAPRMIQLARRMVAAGQACRAEGRPLAFPSKILPAPASAPVPAIASVVSPDAALQLELRHLRKALADHQRAVGEMRQRDAWLRMRADLESAQSSLSRVIAGHVGRTRRLLMWGAGQRAANLCAQYPELREALAGFVDSSPARRHEQFLGRPIFSADDLVAGRDFVVIASMYAGEIEARLQASGLRANDDFVRLDELPPLPA